MTNKEVSERIKYLRQVRGLSARQLSLALGRHETYINKIECADVGIPVESLLHILGQLSVTAEQFFADNYKTWEMDKTIEHGFRQMPEASRQVVLSMLNVMGVGK